MPTPTKKKSPVPREAEELNHNLMLSRGSWWTCCSINATRATKEKLTLSLRTGDVRTARLRRDIFFGELQARGLEVRVRKFSPANLGRVERVRLAEATKPWQDRVAAALAVARAAQLVLEDWTPKGNAQAGKKAPERKHLFLARL
ncbi:MAG: hypothetical protein JWM35_1272 [Verrucomicrobia bacterium]|nr:hypothetical protein [Verrucomicrobiota bacterium]